MNNLDRYFKGQQTNETFVCFCRHHWITLFKEIVFFAIFALLMGYVISQVETIKEILQGSREMKLLFLTGFLMATLYIHKFFIKLLNYFVNIGIITDTRIIDHKKTLFFVDTMDSLDMAQIQNIERVGEGILPNLLGYGDIKIYLTASSGVKTFNCIPNAKFHFRCMNRQKEARQNMQRVHGQINNEPQQEPPQELGDSQLPQIVRTERKIPIEEKTHIM